MVKMIIQLLMIFMIIGTISMIKKNNLKYPVESYILSIVIYTIIIMLLF